jgi:NADPH:quinone reductase-like Zn-dependent oxidoreductase
MTSLTTNTSVSNSGLPESMRPLTWSEEKTLARSYAVVKRGGVLATTVQPIDQSAADRAGIRAVHVVMERNAEDLAELAAMVAKGAVKPRLTQTLPLNEAKKAHELSDTGKTHGKLILKVA